MRYGKQIIAILLCTSIIFYLQNYENNPASAYLDQIREQKEEACENLNLDDIDSYRLTAKQNRDTILSTYFSIGTKELLEKYDKSNGPQISIMAANATYKIWPFSISICLAQCTFLYLGFYRVSKGKTDQTSNKPAMKKFYTYLKETFQRHKEWFAFLATVLQATIIIFSIASAIFIGLTLQVPAAVQCTFYQALDDMQNGISQTGDSTEFKWVGLKNLKKYFDDLNENFRPFIKSVEDFHEIIDLGQFYEFKDLMQQENEKLAMLAKKNGSYLLECGMISYITDNSSQNFAKCQEEKFLKLTPQHQLFKGLWNKHFKKLDEMKNKTVLDVLNDQESINKSIQIGLQEIERYQENFTKSADIFDADTETINILVWVVFVIFTMCFIALFYLMLYEIKITLNTYGHSCSKYLAYLLCLCNCKPKVKTLANCLTFCNLIFIILAGLFGICIVTAAEACEWIDELTANKEFAQASKFFREEADHNLFMTCFHGSGELFERIKMENDVQTLKKLYNDILDIESQIPQSQRDTIMAKQKLYNNLEVIFGLKSFRIVDAPLAKGKDDVQNIRYIMREELKRCQRLSNIVEMSNECRANQTFYDPFYGRNLNSSIQGFCFQSVSLSTIYQNLSQIFSDCVPFADVQKFYHQEQQLAWTDIFKQEKRIIQFFEENEATLISFDNQVQYNSWASKQFLNKILHPQEGLVSTMNCGFAKASLKRFTDRFCISAFQKVYQLFIFFYTISVCLLFDMIMLKFRQFLSLFIRFSDNTILITEQ